MAKESALVLPAEAVAGSQEPVYFGGFPGMWIPGQPVAVSQLGFASEADCDSACEALGLPLEKVKVETGSAPMPPRENHLESETTSAPVEAEEPELAEPEAEAPVEAEEEA